jgi:uncharacterized protein (DUF952 family)
MPSVEPIYHLAPAARWSAWPDNEPYLPAEYDTDGFVHCTGGRETMLAVANRFYRGAPGDFVILAIDPERLAAPLRWEEPSHPAPASGPALAPLFPHIYGPIDRAAILAAYPVERAADGAFLGWQES